MPNHITNRLEIIADTQTVNHILSELKSEGRDIDFNKIVKMPDSINNSSFNISIEYAVKHSLKIECKEEGILGVLQAQNARRTPSPLELSDEDWYKYIQCLNNYRTYGYIYWYDWSIANWGTKWNAYNTKSEGNIITFETAWAGVSKLIQKLSVIYPHVKFIYAYADEDTGSNCGRGEFIAGSTDFIAYESESNEAYELAFELDPSSKEYYELVDGKWKYKEDEQ